MRSSRSRIHIRLWMLMLVSFAIVGGCATLAILNFTLAKIESDSRDELLSLAKIISLQLSPEEQLKLSKSDLTGYRELNALLTRAQREGGSIRRIYTLRKVGSQFELVLDSTIDPNRGLPPSVFSPAPGVDREVKNTFESGLPGVDDTITLGDRTGPFFTAYAPLIDSTGHVVAVVAVDRDASGVAARVDGVKRAAAIALGLVLLLGAIFSLIIVRQLARSASSEAWIKGATTSTRIFRATLLELTLCALAIGVLGIGVYSQIRLGQLHVDEETSLARGRALDQYRTRIDGALKDGQRDSGGLAILRDAAEKDGLLWLAGSLGAAVNVSQDHWREPLWQSLQAIAKKDQDERLLRERLHTQMSDMNGRMTQALMLAIILSFGSLVLLRAAAKQQQELLIAHHDSRRHQVAYEQVATNLPIGFYTYRDGEIEDSNTMWDTMVTRQPGEDRMMAIERAVHPDDLPLFQSTLRTAQETGEPFHLRFRLNASSSEVRNFESRGVWIDKPDEGLDNLLGFFLDITDLATSQEQLEARSREIQAKNFMLSRALSDLEENFEAMVHGLVKAVEAKDPYTAGHSERVMGYSMSIGEVLGLNAHELRVLERGTLIHDVGKIGVPDAVLNKPAKLNDVEFEIIKTHTTVGAQMVRGIPVFEECVPIILHHHERLDGSGYPNGLADAEIPLLVRITSVADVFDALTSTRAYRSAMDVEEAIAILRKEADAGILDGKIVDILADIVKRDGSLWRSPRDQAA